LLSPGDKLKDYEVIAPLTSGGMATLFLARRRGVGGFTRLVALKLVHQHLTEDSAMIKLFLDEARISAHVVHPNVVHVEEVGMEGGIYFIAMEYVHGVSLAQLLKRMADEKRRLSPKLCVWMAAQIAEALHAAHEATNEIGTPLHIVHRDVSPQNVLISHTGHVKLIDFGIAKSQAALHHSEGGAAVLGKLRYMSPEQLHLTPIDRRTDVYALGVMLWEMLTSRSLLRCQRIDDPRDWAIREHPPAPSKYTPLSTSQLDRVVLKAIAHDRNERFETSLQFRSALLRAEPSAARIDAPKITAVLRAVLADELDRQRANLPNEVTVQLEMGTEITSEPKESSLAEFTTHLGNISNEMSIDDSEPTRIKSGGTNPRVRLDSGPVYSTPTVATQALSPEAAQAIAKMRRTATTGVVTVGAVCLAIGLLIGRGTSSPTGPSAEPLVIPSSAALAAPERVTTPTVSQDVSARSAFTTKPAMASAKDLPQQAAPAPKPQVQALAPTPPPAKPVAEQALATAKSEPEEDAAQEAPVNAKTELLPQIPIKAAPVKSEPAPHPVARAKPAAVVKRKITKKKVAGSRKSPY
jgi:serine/threonine protein kinase